MFLRVMKFQFLFVVEDGVTEFTLVRSRFQHLRRVVLQQTQLFVHESVLPEFRFVLEDLRAQATFQEDRRLWKMLHDRRGWLLAHGHPTDLSGLVKDSSGR